MVRRSTPPRKLDERAFPVRVKVQNPLRTSELIRWYDAEVWMRENLGAGEHAHHEMDGYCGHTMAFYFRTIEAAARFLDAHPHLELADQTDRVDHLVAARQWAASGRGPLEPHSTGR